MRAIVTGHSRGLGAAIAAELLSRGIGVLGLSRHGNPELSAQFPQALRETELDLADSDALAQWLGEDALRRFVADSHSVLLINNAGVVQPVGPLETQDLPAISRAVALNVAAPMMLAAALVAATPDARDRRIVHISSGAGRNAYPGWSVYCATKAALDLHSSAVALDRTRALRICSLAPGVIDTDMQSAIRATSLERFPMRPRFEALKSHGDLTPPQDAARRLVDYVLSPKFGETPIADLRD